MNTGDNVKYLELTGRTYRGVLLYDNGDSVSIESDGIWRQFRTAEEAMQWIDENLDRIIDRSEG